MPLKMNQILITLIFITTPVFGQMVHKCPGPDGKPVYQQTPCPDGSGNSLVIETGKASKSRRATDEEITECIRLIKIVHNFKDPESLKVEGSAYVNEYPSGRKEWLDPTAFKKAA